MKRVDLLRAIEASGCEFVRHGGKHDWSRNSTTGAARPIPRHREIQERPAKRIIRQLANPGPQARPADA